MMAIQRVFLFLIVVVTTTTIVNALSIYEFAKSNANFKTLTAAINAAGLESVLNSPGKYTLFAPNDEAFAKLPAGTVDSLLKDIPKLTDILKYHVHPDKMNPTRSRVIDTLCLGTDKSPKQITIKVASWSCVGYCLGGQETPSMCINSNDETAGGIDCSNGVIHVVDTVLLPYEGNTIPTWGSVSMMGERDISGEATLQKGYYGSESGKGKGFRGSDKFDPEKDFFNREKFKDSWQQAANWKGGIDGPSEEQKKKYGQK